MIRTTATALCALLMALAPDALGQAKQPTLSQALPQYAAEVAQARTRLTAANRQLNRLQADLIRAREAVRDEILATEPYQKALAELREARAAHRQSRQEALEPVVSRPAYLRAQEQVAEMDQMIRRLRQLRTTTMTDIYAVAYSKLRWSETLAEMEIDALRDSPQFLQAQDRLGNAATRWSRLQNELVERVNDSSRVTQVQQKLEDARDAVATAQAEFRSAAAAYDVAFEQEAEQEWYRRRYAPSVFYNYRPWRYWDVDDRW